MYFRTLDSDDNRTLYFVAIERIRSSSAYVQMIVQTGQTGLLSEHEVIQKYPVFSYFKMGGDHVKHIANGVCLALKNYHILSKHIRVKMP